MVCEPRLFRARMRADTYAADRVGGEGKPGCRWGERDQARPAGVHSDIQSRVRRLSGVTVRPGMCLFVSI